MDICYRNDRSPILVRKVMTPEGKRRGGIYDQNNSPVSKIVQGELYKAKLNGTHRDVVAGPNEIMYLLDEKDPIEDVEDPRTRAVRAMLKDVGFDMGSGTYHYTPPHFSS